MSPSRTLPTLSPTEVEFHNSSESCYVSIGNRVFDVTDFIDSHPGGGDLILQYGGKDVTRILKDELSHEHSEAAYDILEDSFIGFVTAEKVLDTIVKSKHPDEILSLPPQETESPGSKGEEAVEGLIYATTGMSSAADLSKDTDPDTDYKRHKFLELNKPLFMQLWRSGFSKEFYLEQVHRPRHYKGGESAPLFGNFLEPLSRTAWWVVPMVWLPPISYGTYISSSGFSSPYAQAITWLFGVFLWTLFEYILHRFLFHIDKVLPDNRYAITAHFLLHGIHHYLPMDRLRLVMPPTLFFVLALPFWRLAHTLMYWNWNLATNVFSGGIFGYVCYDLTHYFLHHRTLPAYWRSLKKYHLQHHFMDYGNGFGVSSRFWDQIFGTELSPPSKTIQEFVI